MSFNPSPGKTSAWKQLSNEWKAKNIELHETLAQEQQKRVELEGEKAKLELERAVLIQKITDQEQRITRLEGFIAHALKVMGAMNSNIYAMTYLSEDDRFQTVWRAYGEFMERHWEFLEQLGGGNMEEWRGS